MSLYGALFSGVSGLSAQGNSIAMIGDNISNINTVGYKGSTAEFSTLLTSSSSSTSYSSGGVQSNTTQLIDKQGLIQSTGVSTDMGISGSGFFVVNSSENGTGNVLYTRSGSFRANAQGDFTNPAGYTLMGWPLDSEGRLPGQSGNLNTVSSALLGSLKPVNTKTVSGTAAPTTTVSVGLNLNAAETVLQGAGQTMKSPVTSLGNFGVSSTDVISPEAFAPANLAQGNVLNLHTGTLTNYSYNYTYGGVVESSALPLFGAGTANSAFLTTAGITAGDNFTITNATAGVKTFSFVTSNPDPLAGTFNNLQSLSDAINAVTGLTSRINATTGQLLIAPVNAKEGLVFADVTGNIVAGLGGNVATGTVPTVNNRFATLDGLNKLINLSTGLGAKISNPTADSSLSIFAANPLDTLQFTASTSGSLYNNPFQTAGAGLSTITVTQPGIGLGLANGDNVYVGGGGVVDGVTVAPGIYAISNLTVGATNTTYQITGAGITGTATVGNTSGGGGDNTVTMPYNVASPFTTVAAGSNKITVSAPNNVLNDGDSVYLAQATTISGVTVGPGSYIVANVVSGPAGTYQITGTSVANAGAVAGAVTDGSVAGTLIIDSGTPVLNEFGLITQTATNLKPAYDPLGVTAPNMASGGTTPQFSRNLQVFDALGSGHNFDISYVKLAENTWGVEVYAITPTDISSSRTDGLVASGKVTFNGDGSLKTISTSLSNPIKINWTNKASPSAIEVNWGTAGPLTGTSGAGTVGQANGLRQFSAPYDVSFVDQNGVASGLLTSVSVDASGFVNAAFSNGQTRQIFKVPLASFENPNGLTSVDGNAYTESEGSGNFNLKEAGIGGVGVISPDSLEQANIDLSDQLTQMIVAQRGYEASAKVIKTATDLLDNLLQTFS